MRPHTAKTTGRELPKPMSSSYQRPGLTSKELSEIFLACVSGIRKENILDKGIEHWTKQDKNEIIYKFITNKKVL